MTVTGEIAASQLGMMLPHEHVLVDFIGAEKISPDRYDADEAFRIMLPYLELASKAGCQARLPSAYGQYRRESPTVGRSRFSAGDNFLEKT